MAGTTLYISAGLKKRRYRNTEKTNSQVWELFLPSFFFLQELLSVLTLLTQVFVHLWHRIRGISFFIVRKNKHFELCLNLAI